MVGGSIWWTSGDTTGVYRFDQNVESRSGTISGEDNLKGNKPMYMNPPSCIMNVYDVGDCVINRPPRIYTGIRWYIQQLQHVVYKAAM